MERVLKDREGSAEGKAAVIIGAKNIEDYMKRSYISLVSLRMNFSFPMRKRGGLPTLDLGEFKAWCEELGLPADDPGAITVELIHKATNRLEDQGIQDRQLCGIQEIARFAGFSDATVVDWLNFFPTCPIERGPDKAKYQEARSSTKKLLAWLREVGLPWRPEPAPALRPWERAPRGMGRA